MEIRIERCLKFSVKSFIMHSLVAAPCSAVFSHVCLHWFLADFVNTVNNFYAQTVRTFPFYLLVFLLPRFSFSLR